MALSNLDAKLRVQTRTQIASLQRRLGVTTVYVTHDQTEALTMGDRIAVLKDGILQQVDRPRHMYDRPAHMFVAGFIGSPAMNFLPGRLRRNGGVAQVELGLREVAVDLRRPARLGRRFRDRRGGRFGRRCAPGRLLLRRALALEGDVQRLEADLLDPHLRGAGAR